jgi:hypothetical protein
MNATPVSPATFSRQMAEVIAANQDDPRALMLAGMLLCLTTLHDNGFGTGVDAFDKALGDYGRAGR